MTIMKEYRREIKTVNVYAKDAAKEFERGIVICKTYIQHLREKVLKGCILRPEDEIYFFKHVKPAIVGDCLYFNYLQGIESTRSQCAFHEEKDYLLKRLRKFTHFIKRNHHCYTYYKKDKTKHDREYFIRCNLNTEDYNYHPYSMMDSDFATSKDYLFADFYAHDKVIKYLEKEIIKLEPKSNHAIMHFNQLLKESPINWTGKNNDFTELIYALVTSKSINNGDINIKEATEYLMQVFNIDGLDIYHSYLDIKERKKEKLVFLKKLVEVLNDRIERENDEKYGR